MICLPCRQAADRLTAGINWSAFNMTARPEPATLEPLYAAARQAHAECLGRTSCDCQHKVDRHGLIQR